MRIYIYIMYSSCAIDTVAPIFLMQMEYQQALNLANKSFGIILIGPLNKER